MKLKCIKVDEIDRMNGGHLQSHCNQYHPSIYNDCGIRANGHIEAVVNVIEFKNTSNGQQSIWGL